MRLFLVIPTIDGKLTADTFSSLWRIRVEPSIAAQLYTMAWNQDVVRVRNRAVYEFLKSDADVLWFVDADVGFPPEVPKRMVEAIAAGKHLVAAAYPKKRVDWPALGDVARGADVSPFEWAFQLHEAATEHGPWKQAELVPMGMTMISRELAAKVAEGAPRYGDRYGDGKIHQVPDVFGLMLIQQESGVALLPEDYSFTLRARHFGYQPWVLLDPICTHMGSMCFDVRKIMGEVVG